MVMKVIRRAEYGLAAWLFVFALATALTAVTGGYGWMTLLAAPVAFYWLAVHCMRKKAPHFGSEGLKAGAIWLLIAAFLDFAVMPLFQAPYSAFLAASYNYAIYLELLVVPWFADKTMTGSRKI